MKKKVFSLMMTLLLGFFGLAQAQQSLPYTEGFENGIGSWTMSDCHSSTGVTTDYYNTGSSSFAFHWSTTPPQYLISPELTAGDNELEVEFYYRSRGTSYTETFHVGYSTTTNDVNAFTFGDEISCNSTTWAAYNETLPAGTKYVAIKYTANDQWYLYLDDFTFSTQGGDEPEEPTYEEGLHTLATYGVGENAEELIDVLHITRPNGAWMEPYHFQLYNDGEEDVEVVLIDFLHNNGYFSMAEETEYPFTVAATGLNGAVDLYINTNTEWEDTEEINSLLAVNTTERSTHLFEIIADPYTPYCPDVFEHAYAIGDITAGEPWSMWTSEMWDGPADEYQLHDNYTLPFPEIPEGYDAVMTFTLDHDMMLNASVTDGDCDELNGKVALYRVDFNGEAGPMADNYYDGRPFHNPDAPAAYRSIDFESGNFSQFGNYTNDATYPWFVTAEAAHGGSFGMKSGNGGVASSTSTFTTTVMYTADGTVSFDYNPRGEGSYTAWDKCIFQIDGTEQFRYGAVNAWNSFEANVAAGQHTFTWIYEKDSSVNPTGDCFYVDNIVFDGGRMMAGNRDEFFYDFEDGYQGWTNIDNDGNGYDWWMASDMFSDAAGYGNNGSDDFVLSFSYVNGYGSFDADNYLVSPQAYALGNNASLSFYHDYLNYSYMDYMEVCVSTAETPSASDFTAIWNNGGSRRGNGQGRSDVANLNNRLAEWNQETIDLSDYAGQNVWIAFHHLSYDQFMVFIDDVTVNTGTPIPDEPVEPVVHDGYSAGPEIFNLNVLAGTYYLVASSTCEDFEVTIDFEELPCPIEAVTGVYPEDNAYDIPKNNLTLRWTLNDYANEWRIVFGSTYYPEDEPNHPATYISEWSSELQESLRITDYVTLWNNTNYFWRIEQRSNPGTEYECVTSGPVFGFTTSLNVPTNLQASNTRIFEYEETVTLTWQAIQDRTYRRYRVYMDGELIHETPFNQVVTSYTIPQDMLTYNMNNEHGYIFNVTAVYDEGESPMSNPAEIWVSGNGTVSGYVYEQDETTPIGGVTVTITGTNEFGQPETYTFTTDENGYYEGEVHAGNYGYAVATMAGYQNAETTHELPFDVIYDEETDHVDFIMDELFIAPAHVCAQTTYVQGVQGDSLVHVWWDFNFFTTLTEDFEDFENTPFAWQNDATYPWTLTTDAHEGSYAFKSGNAGVHSSTSTLEVTVNIPQDGQFSFDLWARGESTTDSYDWDVCRFFLDGQQMFQYGQHSGWETYSMPITAGEHNFKWVYKKDSSVHPSAGDCFLIDNIVFVGNAEGRGDRSLHHYNIYRTDCYNDGPYNSDNTVFLSTVWRPDTSYMDVQWPEVPAGVYKWGVSAVYQGNYEGNPNNPRVDYPFEERESEIVWSDLCGPCIDKDMYLYDEVTVNVVMNSADCPVGTKVTFTNTNEGEQFNHPMEPIILDSTGYYVFPSFRKGNYNILVEHAGFETILDYQEIWSATDLRYVMIEIIYNAQNLYVSRTGWAMWEPFIPDGPGAPDNPVGPTTGETFTYGFEGDYQGWTNIINGEGDGWHLATELYTGVDGYGANGSNDFMMGSSYVNYGTYPSYDCDDYLVSPQAYAIGNGASLSFYHDFYSNSYPDYMEVCVATAANPTSADFTAIWNNGGSRRASGNGNRDNNLSFNNRLGNWTLQTLDLSAYAGQNVWIAFHHEAYDQWAVLLDEVTVTTAGGRADRHLEGYKVMCTSIDGEPIFNHNTPADQPFCQLATDQLVEGEHYICKVASIYSTGMSDYIECTWQYEPCEHYAGTVNGVTAEGNTITWDYPEGGDTPVDPDPEPGENATIVLSYPDDIWEDGTGYQMLIDADATAYGTDIDPTGYGPTNFANFEYLIPENAAWPANSGNIVGAGSSASIEIPAGTYDWVIVNPYPQGGIQYIAASNGNVGGCQDDYVFEAGKTYTFTISSYYPNDGVDVVITNSRGYVYNAGVSHMAANNANARRNENAVTVAANATGTLEGVSNFNYAPAMHNPFRGATGYANCVYNMTWPNAYVSFDVDAPANANNIGAVTVNRGGDYADGYFYGYNSDGVFFKIDVETGAVVEQHSTGGQLTEMAYNYANSTMYGIDNSTSGNSQLVTVDLATGAKTAVGSLGVSIVAFAIDLQGNAYGISITDGNFYSINLANATMTQLGNTGKSVNYVQCMNFDHNTETLYWFQIYSTTDCALYTVNTANGACTMLMNTPGEVTSFFVPYEGTTPVDPTPTPAGDILGAMIFVDGEWEAFVEAPTNTYTYEGDGENVCVRIVYDGANELPDNNYYYAMSCGDCVEVNGEEPIEDVCAPVENLIAQYINYQGQEGMYVDWDDPEGAISIAIYADGEYLGAVSAGQHPIFLGLEDGTPAGTFSIGAVAIHADCESDMVTVEAIYDNVYENSIDVALFPNPTKDNVTIQANGMNHITVVNALGQVVYDNAVSGDEFILNMSQFNAGMYMVRVSTVNGVMVKRVTVMQ